MKSIIQFNVFQEDGIYTASAVDPAIATEGSTFEELQKNISDVVSVYFEGEDLAVLGFARFPSIMVNFEIPQSI